VTCDIIHKLHTLAATEFPWFYNYTFVLSKCIGLGTECSLRGKSEKTTVNR